MKRETQQEWRRHRGYLPGFMVTILWLIPAMLVTSVVGFFLARDVFSPKFLQPSKVQAEKPRPIRILSPDEVSRLSKDKDSTVWTEGVKQSDIPQMETQTLYRDDDLSSRHTKHSTAEKRSVHRKVKDKSNAKDRPEATQDTASSEDNPETTTNAAPAQPNDQPSIPSDF